MKLNKFVCFSVMLFGYLTISPILLVGQNDNHQAVVLLEQDHHSKSGSSAEIEEDANHGDEHEEGHTTDTAPLLFIILSLIIGVATRHFVKRSPFPFTVLLLFYF